MPLAYLPAHGHLGLTTREHCTLMAVMPAALKFCFVRFTTCRLACSVSSSRMLCRNYQAWFMQDHKGFVNISQDSFYRDLTQEEHANISEFNFDHPDAFAFDEVVRTLKALKAGQHVDIPVYDFVTSARTPTSIPIAKADVVLFDGILTFYTPGKLLLQDTHRYTLSNDIYRACLMRSMTTANGLRDAADIPVLKFDGILCAVSRTLHEEATQGLIEGHVGDI